jgi:anti-sigma factor RsiW
LKKIKSDIMGFNHTFDHMAEKINLFIDNELSADERESVESQLECDPLCHSLYESELKFKDFVKTNFKRSSLSDDWVQNIKKQIKNYNEAL